MSEEFKPLWKRVNWNNNIDNEDEGERTPLIRESTAIQVDNDSDRISSIPGKYDINADLNNTTDEVHKTIGKLLVRGEDLDDMRQKAGLQLFNLETLEDSSKLFKKTSREQKDKVWWDHLTKSVWTYAFATLCALAGLMLLIMIIESLIKMFSRNPVPVAKPPIAAPPPITGPAPQPPPANPGTGIPAFTCNCYCPPIYYPPPRQTPSASQQSKDFWSVYNEELTEKDDRMQSDVWSNIEKLPHPEIPSSS